MAGVASRLKSLATPRGDEGFFASVASRLVFPTPSSSYTVNCFDGELIWVPKSLDYDRAEPEDCIPCLLLPYPSARFMFYFLHGNAEDIGRCYNFCNHLREQFHVHVLLVEYPGYGLCPGIPTEQSVIENARTGFRFVTEVLKWPLDSVKIIGRSIGTGPAVALAKEFNVSGVVLISPFLSMRSIFAHAVGPVSLLFEEMFRNVDHVDQIQSPTIIVHGRKDHLVPVTHGEELYRKLRVRKLFVDPPDMEHNTNLLTDATYFVLPMLHFFSLPDYCFEDIEIPKRATDKRLCIYFQQRLGDTLRPSFQPMQVQGDDGPLDETMANAAARVWSNMGVPMDAGKIAAIGCDDASTSDTHPELREAMPPALAVRERPSFACTGCCVDPYSAGCDEADRDDAEPDAFEEGKRAAAALPPSSVQMALRGDQR